MGKYNIPLKQHIDNLSEAIAYLMIEKEINSLKHRHESGFDKYIVDITVKVNKKIEILTQKN